MSREYTVEEMQEMFIKKIWEYIHYWQGDKILNPAEKLEGLAFSILNLIDGSYSLPSFLLIPVPHQEDKKESIDNEENYWIDQSDKLGDIKSINGNQLLHEIFFKYRILEYWEK